LCVLSLVAFFSFFLSRASLLLLVLLSFPTRRSSVLCHAWLSLGSLGPVECCWGGGGGSSQDVPYPVLPYDHLKHRMPQRDRNTRSEEHTSELQSRFDLVCRLLLRKKNIIHHY